MAIFNRTYQSADNLTSFIFTKEFLLNSQIKKFSSFHKLSNKAYETIAFEHFVDFYHIRVVNLTQKFHLIVDLSYLILGHIIFRDNFDSEFL